MKSMMSGWSTLRMTILAARRVLPPDLMTPAKASNPFMKLSGPLAVPPPLRAFGGSAQGRKIGAGADAPLEEHAFGLGQSEDGVERVFHRVDEAGGALRLGVSGDAEFDLLASAGSSASCWPSELGSMRSHPTLNQTGELKAAYWRTRMCDEFVVESGAVFRSAEVALGHAPVADGFGDAGDELADSGFALGSADLAVQIFAGHDVGGGHRPVFGDFDVFLLEDDVALGSR